MHNTMLTVLYKKKRLKLATKTRLQKWNNLQKKISGGFILNDIFSWHTVYFLITTCIYDGVKKHDILHFGTCMDYQKYFSTNTISDTDIIKISCKKYEWVPKLYFISPTAESRSGNLTLSKLLCTHIHSTHNMKRSLILS